VADTLWRIPAVTAPTVGHNARAHHAVPAVDGQLQ
jgi:hypothetical protein